MGLAVVQSPRRLTTDALAVTISEGIRAPWRPNTLGAARGRDSTHAEPNALSDLRTGDSRHPPNPARPSA